MHKKSIEASEKLSGDTSNDAAISPVASDSSTGGTPVDDSGRKSPSEFKSESIASLRAKAIQHSAKVLEAATGNGTASGSGFDSANSSSSASDESLTLRLVSNVTPPADKLDTECTQT